MSEAVLYARFSPGANHKKRDVDDKRQLSTDAQLAQCRRYCDFHEMRVIAAFADEGISGRSIHNRPGFTQAMDMACQQKAVLVIYSLSRFSRSLIDVIESAERLKKAGADLASLKEQIDSTTPMGRYVFRMFAALAELIREQIAERTSDAMLYYQSQNRRMSDRCPFGWKRDPADDTMMVEDPSEQAIIERIISLRKQGGKLREISRILWSEGITGRRYPVFEKVPQGRWNKLVKTDKVIGLTSCWFNHSLITSILKRAGVE